MDYRAVIGATFATIILSTNAAAVTFPVDSEWIAVTYLDGVVVGDPEGDVFNYFDIVGDTNDAAFFLSANNDDLFFRLRLDENIVSSTGKFNSFGFHVLFDTDGNASNYEYSLVFDGNNSDVGFFENTTFDSNWASDIPETELNNYSSESNAQLVNANTSFGGSNDYFLDIAMSITDLNAAGIYLTDGLSVAACTSSNAVNCNKDIAGFEASDPIAFSDAATLSSVPIPAAAWLFGSGLIGLIGVARRKKA